MRVREIDQFFSEWAPGEVAWEKDNNGLQVGNDNASIKGVLVTLDITGKVLAEAVRRRANLIISHHPLLFRPLHSIDSSATCGRLVESIFRNRLHVYSAHTNLDFTRGGTSFALAERLGLKTVDFLRKPYHLSSKLVTFVPQAYVERVARAMSKAGAGHIGNYTECSFRSEGTGTFRPNARATPAVGKRGAFETVPETRLEMIVENRHVGRVVNALKAAHPYEEPAYDILRVENRSNDFGMGAVGELARPQKLEMFLRVVKKRLGAQSLRWTGTRGERIRRVAACGGSGADLLDDAIRQNADVFVTADVKYHSFHDADGRIALVDAGHYETEVPVVAAVVRRLTEYLRHRGIRIPVYAARFSTNPIAGM